MLKKILYALLIILLVIQFIRPEKNNSGENKFAIETQYYIPDEINLILKSSCDDCHRNTTIYPWYSFIQPVAWYLNNHIVDGKKHLNFDEFSKYRLAKQFHKLEEINEMVATDEMPMSSYTLIHSNAQLTENQKELLIKWSKNLRDTMSARYPSDSLDIKLLKRKKS